MASAPAAGDGARTAPYRFREAVYPKAMLARLESGHRIDLHIDTAGGGVPGSHPFVHKVHVPLETNPSALLRVAGASIHAAAGSAWDINNLAPHGAFNGGARDRIHFIFEVFEGAGHDIREGLRENRVRAAIAGRTVSQQSGNIS